METRDKIALAAASIAALALIPPWLGLSKGASSSGVSITQSGSGNSISLNSPVTHNNFFSSYINNYKAGIEVITGNSNKPSAPKTSSQPHSQTQSAKQTYAEQALPTDRLNPGEKFTASTVEFQSLPSREQTVIAQVSGATRTQLIPTAPYTDQAPFSADFEKSAVLLAGIEIGSKGVRARAFKFRERSEFPQFFVRTVYSTEFRVETYSEDSLSDSTISSIVQSIKETFERLKDLQPRYIAVVAPEQLKQKKNSDALASAIESATGYRLGFVTADEELFYVFLANTPLQQLSASSLLDVGSASTKIALAAPGGSRLVEVVQIPYGAVSLAAAASTGMKRSIEDTIASDVLPLIRSALRDKPQFGNSNRRLYLIGGAAWAAATLANAENKNDFLVRLNSADLQALLQTLKDGTRLPTDEESAKVFDAYSKKELDAGIRLLSATMRELNASSREVFFARESQWLYGYLISRYQVRR